MTPRLWSPTALWPLAILSLFGLSWGVAPSLQAAEPPQPVDSQTGACRWSTDFTVSGLDGTVLAIAAEDTALGTRIYVGGEFAAADGNLANHIAIWEDGQWGLLEGPGGVGVNGPVRALAFWDDGSGPALYVGGDFTSAGGVTVANVARWKDGEWSALGPEVEPGVSADGEFAQVQVQDMLPFDDGSGSALYVTGFFTTAGGQPAFDLARWDGDNWSSPVDDPSHIPEPRALEIWDDGNGRALWVGFHRLEDRQLVPLADPDASRLLDSIVWDDGTGPALFLAGRDRLSRAFVTKWTGGEWLTVGQSTESVGLVFSLAQVMVDGESLLIAGGNFREIDGAGTGLIAAFDGSEWRGLGAPSSTGIEGSSVQSLAAAELDGPKLVVGGNFTAIEDTRTTHFALWDGTNWDSPTSSVPHRGGLLGNVLAMVEWDDGTGLTTYVGGCFLYASGRRASHVAKWDSGRWVSLLGINGGVGVSDTVYALTVWDDGNGPALYAGGSFRSADGIEVNGVARWNGESWSALGGPMGVGLSGNAYSLTAWDDGDGTDLYVGGFFLDAGGISTGSVARWDGENWSALALDSLYGDPVRHFAAWDDGNGEDLYVGGSIRGSAGGISLRAVGGWDGDSWFDPDPERTIGVEFVYGLTTASVDGQLYLYSAGEGGVKRFDGHAWSHVGADGDQITDQAYEITSWNEGGVERLIAGLSIPPYLQAWDGTQWSVITGPGGEGPNQRVLSLHTPSRERSLWVGGNQTAIGAIPSSGIARLTCESPCGDSPDQSLCLGDQDRFTVEVHWRDFEGNEGGGRVVPFQTDDSGLFYFFGADNWELLVKVLDGCGLNDHFWVFSAATTTVEYTLTVTDTFTGRKKRYFNPLGTAAPSVTDTTAFPTCDAGGLATASNGLNSLTDEGIHKSRSVQQGGTEKAGCASSDTVMCLEGGRFALEIDWRDFEGNEGPAKVVAGVPADGSGLFQFFGENNWEVLVKVLDGCGLNDRFWVFSAATTNVEYTLRVTTPRPVKPSATSIHSATRRTPSPTLTLSRPAPDCQRLT